jgi:2-polyprenyl-6-methoxyphenol hydroxylase-like FAD-dependent oxidoreductase
MNTPNASNAKNGLNSMSEQATRPKKYVNETLNVLVSGASFAGLATAYWMNRLGYKVTVVEVAKGLKKGGTPVDIREGTIGIVKRMGLFDRIWEKRLKPKRTQFRDSTGVTVAAPQPQENDGEASNKDCEIERDALLAIMFDEIKSDVEFIFDDSIASLTDQGNEVDVTFKSGGRRSFALLFGCDGNHSSMRSMRFGPEAQYSFFLEHYFGIAIVEQLLIEENTTQIYNVPGKAVMLNAYNNKTDIVFTFYSENEILYDYRDLDQQRRIVFTQFADAGWRTPELLEEAARCKNFYFDTFCQIRMPSWSIGRVALVGDAGYCASPAAGMGGSLAIVGATALADALLKHDGHFETAFEEYEKSLRPFVDHVQAQAIEGGLTMFAPRTEEDIRRRNAQLAQI